MSADKSTGSADKLIWIRNKSTGAAEKSTGSAYKSTGSADKSTRSVDKSTGSADKSTGSANKSTGSADKSTGTSALINQLTEDRRTEPEVYLAVEAGPAGPGSTLAPCSHTSSLPNVVVIVVYHVPIVWNEHGKVVDLCYVYRLCSNY